jgi:hypothetical protein
MVTRILILDDDQTRHDAFKARLTKHYGSDGVVLVQHISFEKFNNCLTEMEKFDIIYLDHDLGDHTSENIVRGSGIYGRDLSFNGQDAALCVAALPKDKHPDKVIVHSWNPPGARMMVNILREAGISVAYEPFSPPQEGELEHDAMREAMVAEYMKDDDYYGG